MATKTETRVLTDHDEIREWAEERSANPAHVKRTGSRQDTGILRLDFPGYSGADSLEEISWDVFFEKFDESGLALLVQDTTANGERSNFNKLISRETAGQSKNTRSGSSRSGSSRAASSHTASTHTASTRKSTSTRTAASRGKTASSGSSSASSSSASGGSSRKKTTGTKRTNAGGKKRSNSGSKSGSRGRAA